ncbi:DUF2502 domain-containing protein [Rouxiella sp. Mn2063]|uniref:DUF2502 domain-containing protein n=1 Tax=Rouxiella sp. Mn2063 TaxID=3395262 RepID=UPI003BD9F2BD
MKKRFLILAVMLVMPAVSQADVEIGVNVPGVSLHIGDRDTRGYYWDGGYWRPPGWWQHHYRARGHWVYYEPAPQPMYWHPGYWREGPPPGYWRGPPRWHEGPPPGRW